MFGFPASGASPLLILCVSLIESFGTVASFRRGEGEEREERDGGISLDTAALGLADRH